MKYFLSVIFLVYSLLTYSQTKVYDVVVAKDGSGSYTSLSTAIERLGVRKRTIFIKNGTYNEKVLISGLVTNVRLIGESTDGVIITYDDYAGKSTSSSSTANSYTFKIEADGFYAENITFQNTATQAQAVAIYTKADSITFKNCKFIGFQDTHFADNGRQYYINCEIKGDVDFIFGNAAAYYDNCTIISSNRKGGYVTAPSEAVLTGTKTSGGTLYKGFLFKNCTLQKENGLSDNTVYLGRPWGKKSASVYINCRIDKHIKPAGWSVWTTDPNNEDHNNHEYAFFAEYNSMDLSGVALDVSQREAWSYQLETKDTIDYTMGSYFKGWNPLIKTKTLKPPSSVSIVGNFLHWEAVDKAMGYAVFINDTILGFTTETTYDISNMVNENFAVKTINVFGAIGDPSNIALSINEKDKLIRNYNIYQANGVLFVPANKLVSIYNVNGKQIKSIEGKEEIDIQNLKSGVFFINIILKNNQNITQKIVVQN